MMKRTYIYFLGFVLLFGLLQSPALQAKNYEHESTEKLVERLKLQHGWLKTSDSISIIRIITKRVKGSTDSYLRKKALDIVIPQFVDMARHSPQSQVQIEIITQLPQMGRLGDYTEKVITSIDYAINFRDVAIQHRAIQSLASLAKKHDSAISRLAWRMKFAENPDRKARLRSALGTIGTQLDRYIENHLKKATGGSDGMIRSNALDTIIPLASYIKKKNARTWSGIIFKREFFTSRSAMRALSDLPDDTQAEILKDVIEKLHSKSETAVKELAETHRTALRALGYLNQPLSEDSAKLLLDMALNEKRNRRLGFDYAHVDSDAAKTIGILWKHHKGLFEKKIDGVLSGKDTAAGKDDKLNAIRIIGYLGDEKKKYIPKVLKLAQKDADTAVRRIALKDLVTLDDNPDRFVEQFVEISLKDSDEFVRGDAVKVISGLGEAAQKKAMALYKKAQQKKEGDVSKHAKSGLLVLEKIKRKRNEKLALSLKASIPKIEKKTKMKRPFCSQDAANSLVSNKIVTRRDTKELITYGASLERVLIQIKNPQKKYTVSPKTWKLLDRTLKKKGLKKLKAFVKKSSQEGSYAPLVRVLLQGFRNSPVARKLRRKSIRMNAQRKRQLEGHLKRVVKDPVLYNMLFKSVSVKPYILLPKEDTGYVKKKEPGGAIRWEGKGKGHIVYMGPGWVPAENFYNDQGELVVQIKFRKNKDPLLNLYRDDKIVDVFDPTLGSTGQTYKLWGYTRDDSEVMDDVPVLKINPKKDKAAIKAMSKFFMQHRKE